MTYLISDAAKQVQVETHVLRYWEEELKLPIKRNEQGHRYYTKEDVDRFMEIKNMKESGLQLKAIRMILRDGKLDMLSPAEEEVNAPIVKSTQTMPNVPAMQNTAEDKAKKLQWMLQQLFKESLQENNQELSLMIKEIVLKELDYQFRVQDEREEERHTQRMRMDEEHFKKVDEMLRSKRKLFKK